MGLINILLLFISMAYAQELPKFLTKHAPETLRFISMDGKSAYVMKRPGVLGLISSFRSIDFITDASSSDFIITASPDHIRLAIEVVPNIHTEYSLVKNHKISIINWGNSIPKDVGIGRNARLHLKDEWISFYNAEDRVLHIHYLPGEKKHEIKLAPKANPFFLPEVVMIAQDTVTYTDINDKGLAALISFNLNTKKSTIVYRSPQNGTKLELCRNQGYLAIGDFPYEGVNRGSQIMKIKITNQTNLSGYTTVYNTIEQDIGNMVCLPDSIYFIKTMNQNKSFGTKTTDVVKLELETSRVVTRSQMGNVTQLLEMDGRVLVPFRGDFYLVEGNNDLSSDTLKSTPKKNEELPLDI